MTSPTVSVVIATYNASMMLSYAIRSVINSSFSDWELVIVGDHCTDDTEAVIAEFEDPRIRFHNLPKNSGHQATPSNMGISMARGQYLCFLNQDDMYQAHHLASMLELMQDESPDFIIARYANIEPGNILDGRPLLARNSGYSPEHPQYQPDQWYIASSWFLHRDVAAEIGPWSLEKDLYITPSQEWLFRAYRMRKSIRLAQRSTLIALPTGWRGRQQGELRHHEHEYIYRRLIQPRLDSEELSTQLIFIPEPPWWKPRRMLRLMYRATLARMLIALDIHPRTPELAMKFGRRGNLVRRSVERTIGRTSG